MKKVLQLSGLDCPVCAGELEELISKIEGISYVSLTFVNQKLTVEYDSEETLARVKETANNFEEVKVVEKIEKEDSSLKRWLPIIASAAFFLVGLLLHYIIGNNVTQIVQYVCYAAAYLCAGYEVLVSTVKNLLKGKIFDENFLMTVASIGAIFLQEYGEAVLVMLLYQIGETLQGIAVGASRKSVTELMGLKTETANRYINDTDVETVTPETLEIGDILLVKAGEKIPCDGELLSETATLDTKPLTGESEPRANQCGDELLSGCINVGGVFKMRVTHPVQDSAVQKILDLMENSASEKAAPEKFITKFAKVYTPVVCLLALCVAFLPPLVTALVTEGAFYLKDFARWAQTALTFLVISCPCALVISVPLTYFSGIGSLARKGVLVKGATHLDEAAKIKTVALDKTGTLTEGDFKILSVTAVNGATEELLSVAAAVERGSSHPIAKAFWDTPTEKTAINVVEIAGKGVQAEIEGAKVLVGNLALLKESGVDLDEVVSPYTLVYVSENGVYLGAIEIGDKIREDAKEAVAKLHALGVDTVMLTGDHAPRAETVAKEVGVKEWKAELLPDGKLENATALKERGKLLFVGDGINDAPVMAAANCAVSMGKLGSAAAVEASDFVLVSDSLSAVPELLKQSRKTRRIVKQNIVFSVAMKAAFMVLGVIGLPLALAVFADVGVMLLAVLNALRMQMGK